jgi:hypothetical protein
MKPILAFAIFLALGSAASAQTVDCKSIGKAAERLACYDKNFPPVQEKAKTAAPGPSAQAGTDDAEESRMKKALHAICVHC